MIKTASGRTAYVILGLISVLLLVRCWFSFDVLDESYYIACIDRFWKGDCPVIDEWHPTQLFFLMQLPIYSFYRWIVPNGDGVYLFFRLFSILLTIIVAFLVHQHVVKYYRKLTALLCALAVLLFCRSNILGVSYYGIFVDTIVLMMLCEERRIRRDMDKVAIGVPIGALLGISIICMPFQILLVIPVGVYYLKKKCRKTLAGVIIGAGIVVCYVLSLLVHTKTSIKKMGVYLPYLFMDEEHSAGYLKRLLSSLKLSAEAITIWGCIVFAIMLIIVSFDKYNQGILAVLFTTGVCLSTWKNLIFSDRIYVILVFYMLPILVAFYKQKKKEYDTIPALYVCVGLLCSFCFVSGSNMNIDAISTGMVLSTIGCFLALDRSELNHKRLCKMAYYTVCILIILVCLGQRIVLTANDLPLTRMNTCLTSGLLKGIWVSDTFAEQYEKIQRDLELLEEKTEATRVYITNAPSWLYVVEAWKCSNSSTWGRVVLSDKMDSYYSLHPDYYPDVIVQYKTEMGKNRIDEHLVPYYIIDEFENHGYREVIGKELNIYIRSER